MVGDYDEQVSGTNCVFVVILPCLVGNVDFLVIPLRHLLYQKMGIFVPVFLSPAEKYSQMSEQSVPDCMPKLFKKNSVYCVNRLSR